MKAKLFRIVPVIRSGELYVCILERTTLFDLVGSNESTVKTRAAASGAAVQLVKKLSTSVELRSTPYASLQCIESTEMEGGLTR